MGQGRRRDWRVRTMFGPKTALGRRRTEFAQAPVHDEAAIEAALVEREPVTVIVSEKGWIRTLRGHVTDLSVIVFKTDDRLKVAFFTETNAKCLVLTSNGRFYTLEVAKLPGGRGHGEPIRLFIDIEQEADVITVFPFRGDRRLLVATASGRGLLLPKANAWPIPARAGRSSTWTRRISCGCWSQSKVSWSPASAKIANCWCFLSTKYPR